MKKSLLYLFVFISSSLSAQKYVPFPTENAQWNIHYTVTDAWINFGVIKSIILNYVLRGDTIVNTKTYQKLYLKTISSGSAEMKLKGLIREENKRIYLINLAWGGYMSQIKPLSSNTKSDIKQFLICGDGDNVECLLYDFK